ISLSARRARGCGASSRCCADLADGAHFSVKIPAAPYDKREYPAFSAGSWLGPAMKETTATGAIDPRPSHLGLSGKLLVLTILFVMIAEVLIYVPSMANFRLNWLKDRLGGGGARAPARRAARPAPRAARAA